MVEVETPRAEWINASEDYMSFLEKCCRVCYRSEGRIAEGSAEKLLGRIVGSKHYSVLEHVNSIVQIDNLKPEKQAEYILAVLNVNPFFGFRFTRSQNGFILSGNLRMWMELLADPTFQRHLLHPHLQNIIAKKWPFFFSGAGHLPGTVRVTFTVRLLDENPLTNKDNLSVEDIKKHMTMTYKLTGDRSFSHQLVRHRLCSFSQNSQRYIDYNKRSMSAIVPPEAEKIDPIMWMADIDTAYNAYIYWRTLGLNPEDARGYLPNATATEVVTTSTIKNWIHVFNQRSRNHHAQWQIRQIIGQVEEHMESVLPFSLE